MTVEEVPKTELQEINDLFTLAIPQASSQPKTNVLAMIMSSDEVVQSKRIAASEKARKMREKEERKIQRDSKRLSRMKEAENKKKMKEAAKLLKMKKSCLEKTVFVCDM